MDRHAGHRKCGGCGLRRGIKQATVRPIRSARLSNAQSKWAVLLACLMAHVHVTIGSTSHGSSAMQQLFSADKQKNPYTKKLEKTPSDYNGECC